MSQLISHRSNSLEIHAHREPSFRWASDILLAAPRALLRAARRAWTTHSDRRLLQELSDHQLRDIGIRREHIPHMARHGWDG